jgi:hypothetical protein
MEMFLKPKRPMNLRFKPAAKISFDLTQQNSPWLWKRKILRRPMEGKALLVGQMQKHGFALLIAL